MLPRACLVAVLLFVCAHLALAAESVEVSAVGQSLLQDIQSARTALDAGQSPWQDPAGRPQAEPLLLLASELPGHGIWLAFKPVDQRVRECFRLQRQGYIDKDLAIRQRREAREGLPALAEAIRTERAAYNRTIINLAVRQVAQVDNALKHMEYYSALCVLWSMADMLGLWDRQAALEVAADHVGSLRSQGSNREHVSEKTARRMTRVLDVIARMVDGAVGWTPAPEGIGPVDITLQNPDRARNESHFADHAVLGGAYGPWRDNAVIEPSATPLVFDETNSRLILASPAPETQCLHPAPRYRDWQRELGDYRYGWTVYTHTAAQQKLGCDWRKLEPWTTNPQAKGAQNAGGL